VDLKAPDLSASGASSRGPDAHCADGLVEFCMDIHLTKAEPQPAESSVGIPEPGTAGSVGFQINLLLRLTGVLCGSP